MASALHLTQLHYFTSTYEFPQLWDPNHIPWHQIYMHRYNKKDDFFHFKSNHLSCKHLFENVVDLPICYTNKVIRRHIFHCLCKTAHRRPFRSAMPSLKLFVLYNSFGSVSMKVRNVRYQHQTGVFVHPTEFYEWYKCTIFNSIRKNTILTVIISIGCCFI